LAQLWRVAEKRFAPIYLNFLVRQILFLSDIIVQIVDARNPLLFRCEDLESYVRELSVDNKKINVILVNKADLLTDEQR
jgi:large subunit GTPase 1